MTDVVEAAEASGTQAETAEPPTTLGIPAGGKVEHLALGKLSEDQDYMFRASLRVADLKTSIEEEGQQLPIIVRKIGKTEAMRYQVISGFRRLTAIQQLGWPTIAAIVRDDIDDDEAAFRASVLENTARKTYSDIDRAIAIQRYRASGHKATDVAAMMGLSDRRRKMIESLLKMPKVVQDAVDDPEHPFTTKHAIQLSRLKKRYAKLTEKKWVKKVTDDELSVNQMVRAVNAEHGSDGTGSAGFSTLFQARGTDLAKGEVWFAPTRVKVSNLSDDEKGRLKAELEKVLAAL